MNAIRRREKPGITKSKTDSDMANKGSFEKLLLDSYLENLFLIIVSYLF